MTNSKNFNHTHKSVSKMKKFPFALVAVMFSLVATQVSAQTVKANKTMYVITSDVANKSSAQKQMDTITNTATKTQTLAIAQLHRNAEVHVKARQLSGTAAGYVILSVSNDGTNFAKVDSVRIYSVAGIQTKRIALNATPAKYIRTSYTGVGTMSAELKSEFITLAP